MADQIPALLRPDKPVEPGPPAGRQAAIDLVARVLSDIRHELESHGQMRIADARVGETLTEENSSQIDHDMELASIELAMAIVARAGGCFHCSLDELARDDYIRHVLGHDNPAVVRWDEARERRRRLVQERHRETGEERGAELTERLMQAIYGEPGQEHWRQARSRLLDQQQNEPAPDADPVLARAGDYQVKACCSEGRVFLERISTAEGTEVPEQEAFSALNEPDAPAALARCFEQHL